MGTPTSADTAPAAPPPARPRRRRAVLIGAVVVVAALVVVAGLFVGGFLTSSKSSAAPGPYETFDQATPTGTQAASGVAGGPWLVALATAVVIPTPVFVQPTNLSNSTELSSLHCTLTWIASPTEAILIPATPASAPAGSSAFWVFGLRNASGAIAFTTVTSGTAAPLLVASGSGCESVTSHLEAIGSIVDSPAAVAAAGASGGTSFLAAHPNATRIWTVNGGIEVYYITSQPTWSIVDTTCVLPTPLTASGTTFNATVNAITGKVSASGNTSGSCALGATGVLSVLLAAPLLVGPGKAI
jgi:hypothetical protein